MPIYFYSRPDSRLKEKKNAQVAQGVLHAIQTNCAYERGLGAVGLMFPRSTCRSIALDSGNTSKIVTRKGTWYTAFC